MSTGGTDDTELSCDPLHGFEYFCQPCSKLEPAEHLEAEGYCKDCSEFLCARCFQVHKIPSALRHHVLLNKTEMRRLDPPQPEGSSRADKCPQHQEYVQFFCPRHTALACKTCRSTGHKLCSNVVRIRISPDLVNTCEYKTLGKTLNKMESKLQGAQVMLQGKKRTVDATFSKVQQNIRTFKEEVISMLNDMEKDLVENANRLRQEDKDCVERKIEGLAEMLQEVQRVRTELQNLATDQQFSLLFLAMKKCPERLTAVQSTLDDLDPEAVTTNYSFLPNLQVIDILGSPAGLGKITQDNDSPRVRTDHWNSSRSPEGLSPVVPKEHHNNLGSSGRIGRSTDVFDARKISDPHLDNQTSSEELRKTAPGAGPSETHCDKQLKIFGLHEEPIQKTNSVKGFNQPSENEEVPNQLDDDEEVLDEPLNISNFVVGLEIPTQGTMDKRQDDQHEEQFTISSHPSLEQQFSMDSDPSCDSLPDVTDDELDGYMASDEVSGELDATPLTDIYVDSRHSTRPCWITGVAIVGNTLVVTDHNNCKVNFVELGDNSDSRSHSPNLGQTSKQHSNVALTLGQHRASADCAHGTEVREMKLAKAPWDVVEIEDQDESQSPRGVAPLPRPYSQGPDDPFSHENKNKDYRYRDSRKLASAKRGKGQTPSGNCRSNTIYHDSGVSGWGNTNNTNQRAAKSPDSHTSNRPSLFSLSGKFSSSQSEDEHDGSSHSVAVTVPEKRKIVVLRLGRRITKTKKIPVSGECYGIAYHQGKLVVSYKNPGKLEIMDTMGRVQRKIEQDRAGPNLISFPAYIALSSDGGMIYVSDKEKDSVTRISINGRIDKVFTDSRLKCPSKLAIDSNGNIFVGGRDSKNVVVMDSAMSRVQVMLSTLMSPHALCYESETARLYLGLFGNNTISVYQVS